jgi:ABC-type hemin transport system substrate-binding protein
MVAGMVDRHALDLPLLPPRATRAAREVHAALAGLRAAQRHELSQHRDVLDLPAAATAAAMAIIAGESTDADTVARVVGGIETLHSRLRWQRLVAFTRSRHDAAAT